MADLSESILESTVDVIAEVGLEGMSIRVVAARAGVSIGAVQHHFPTKQALVVAAHDHVSAAFRHRAERALTGRGAAFERLSALLRVLALVDEREADAHAAVRLAYVARAANDLEIRERHVESVEGIEHVLERLLRAIDGGVPTIVARDTAASLLALADGIGLARVASPERMPHERGAGLIDRALHALVTQRPWARL